METLQHDPSPAVLCVAPPANDDCARAPVAYPQPPYRRTALRSAQARRNAAAVALALAFCVHWFVIRDAMPAEIDAVRADLQRRSGAEAVARFDAALAAREPVSLLHLHLVSRRSETR
ncbi:hypothetical protein [Sinimarinibacterium thermocellulolyticum]|uniref:Uncharacterized protein n=1 Tax=Sinimarinibacterium thermocellulolyticum TaxID=3170016 RepID=A0ABV2AAX5_9GAMM